MTNIVRTKQMMTLSACGTRQRSSRSVSGEKRKKKIIASTSGSRMSFSAFKVAMTMIVVMTARNMVA